MLLDKELMSLPRIFLKHIEHARTVSSHGIPFGCIIKKVLEYLGVYREGAKDVLLGKPLYHKCIAQAYFKWEGGQWVKTPRLSPTQTQEEGEADEVLRLEGPGSMPESDQVFVKLGDMISAFTTGMYNNFLALAKQVKQVGERHDLLFVHWDSDNDKTEDDEDTLFVFPSSLG